MPSNQSGTVACPVCSRQVPEKDINYHLDNNCQDAGTSSQKPNAKVQSSIASLFTPTGKGQHHDAPSSSQTPRTANRAHESKKRAQPDDISFTLEPGPSKRTRLQSAAPLAERLRPQTLDEFVGQPHLTGPDSLLMHLMDTGSTGSMIFWGPPGCGKTTLARLLAKRTSAVFKELSATDSGIGEVKAVAEEAKRFLALTGRRTILFLDEVHRFNKAQQDIFLPYLEHGHLQLIGATTENPSFKLTGALISRCRVFVLERLTDEDIRRIITQAVERVSASTSDATSVVDADMEDIPSSQPEEDPLPELPSSLSSTATAPTDPAPPFPSYPQLTPKLLSSIVSLSAGDARTALSLLELVLTAPPTSSPDTLLDSLRRSVSTSYDRTGESHYDMISALHKSVRGSQPSAALYWLARMLTAGEDPLYIARRMVVCASEDIGLADVHALPLAMAALQACQVIGMPECRINLAHLISYLAEAPKSTRAYQGYNRAEVAAKSDPTAPIPLPVRNAPTKLMKELGYARGYCYNPDYIHPVTNDYLPPPFKDQVFLKPVGDTSDKIWDEDALHRWELDENNGGAWEGRGRVAQPQGT
ncbi:P-loop containing nucleoside triphosphate hydrolase protein [Rhodofomes roseus]|uniref:P-loop containing nucleoside triphosphate hydrolase protein n=1 Tax=Rhodofomes roseus TaxID=34475 RepID=A0ABQ8KP30_9APHY|nr:P-loop containing nucleoside triphosphate hydrolase protein [Rhodofomes roseus]KAH9839556.1 P-loop containing nucleoside triphosphate hydrolase protein [Rhodofomes roseus]